jgi:hypothetical protein
MGIDAIQTLLQSGGIPATIAALALLVKAYGSARSQIILAKAKARLPVEQITERPAGELGGGRENFDPFFT